MPRSPSAVTIHVMTHDFIEQIRKTILRADRHAERRRATLFSETTTRPAFREIIDNLQRSEGDEVPRV
ncbi:hypothetical protein HYPP_03822 [Hyphomicrobium sp. ghe19]|nr:hypothetical protein HYPP_03822 [Hyphomicrobium sp. ghe19]